MANTPSFTVRLAVENREVISQAVQLVKVPGMREKLAEFIKGVYLDTGDRLGTLEARTARLEAEVQQLREVMQRPIADTQKATTQKATRPVIATTQASLPTSTEKAATGPTEARNAAFGAKLREAREAAGLSQKALAEQAGIASGTISEVERGIKPATPETITGLATVFSDVLAW